jgi:hypothetical protein
MDFIVSKEKNLAWSQLGFKWNNTKDFLKTDTEKFASINEQDVIMWLKNQVDNIEITGITELNINQLSMLSKILSKNEEFMNISSESNIEPMDYENANENISRFEIIKRILNTFNEEYRNKKYSVDSLSDDF